MPPQINFSNSSYSDSSDSSAGENDLFCDMNPQLVGFLSDSLLDTPTGSPQSRSHHKQSVNTEASLGDDDWDNATRDSINSNKEENSNQSSELLPDGKTEASQKLDPSDSPSIDKLIATMESAIWDSKTKMAPTDEVHTTSTRACISY